MFCHTKKVYSFSFLLSLSFSLDFVWFEVVVEIGFEI